MALVKTNEEIKQVVAVGKNLSYSSVAPYFASAERDYVLPALGSSLLATLTAAYNALPTPMPAELLALLPYVQAVVINIGYGNYVEGVGTIQVSDAGITSAVGENEKTPFKWQIDQTKAYHIMEGLKAVDALLEFLEANKSAYSSWASSTQYTLQKSTLLHTTAQLDETYPIQGSRQVFLLLKPAIAYAEHTTITELLGGTLYDSLLVKIRASATFTSTEQKIVDLCRQAATWLAVRDSLPLLLAKFSSLGIIRPGVDSITISGDIKTPADLAIIQRQQLSADGRAMEILTRLRNYLTANATALSWTDPTAEAVKDYNKGVDGGLKMF